VLVNASNVNVKLECLPARSTPTVFTPHFSQAQRSVLVCRMLSNCIVSSCRHELSSVQCALVQELRNLNQNRGSSRHSNAMKNRFNALKKSTDFKSQTSSKPGNMRYCLFSKFISRDCSNTFGRANLPTKTHQKNVKEGPESETRGFIRLDRKENRRRC